MKILISEIASMTKSAIEEKLNAERLRKSKIDEAVRDRFEPTMKALHNLLFEKARSGMCKAHFMTRTESSDEDMDVSGLLTSKVAEELRSENFELMISNPIQQGYWNIDISLENYMKEMLKN